MGKRITISTAKRNIIKYNTEQLQEKFNHGRVHYNNGIKRPKPQPATQDTNNELADFEREYAEFIAEQKRKLAEQTNTVTDTPIADDIDKVKLTKKDIKSIKSEVLADVKSYIDELLEKYIINIKNEKEK